MIQILAKCETLRVLGSIENQESWTDRREVRRIARRRSKNDWWFYFGKELIVMSFTFSIVLATLTLYIFSTNFKESNEINVYFTYIFINVFTLFSIREMSVLSTVYVSNVLYICKRSQFFPRHCPLPQYTHFFISNILETGQIFRRSKELTGYFLKN